MKNWKTTAWGIAIVAAFISKNFMPEQADFIDGLIMVLIAAGFIQAKDYNK